MAGKKVDLKKPLPNPFDKCECPKPQKGAEPAPPLDLNKPMPNPFVDECECPKPPKSDSPVSRLWKK